MKYKDLMEIGKAIHVQNSATRTDDDDGQWITTEGGHKLMIGENGEIVGGSPHAVLASKGVKIEKQGSTFVARGKNGYAIASGKDENALAKKVSEQATKEGPAFGMKRGESKTISGADTIKPYREQLVSMSAEGSSVTTKDGVTLTKGKDDGWRGEKKGREIVMSSSRVAIEEITEFKVVKK